MRLRRNTSILILSFGVWMAVSALALRFGSVSSADLHLVLGLRLSRVLLASAVGMGLSVAGLVLQAVFSNPLCEPYTIGVSSGASLGAVAGASLGVGLRFLGLVGSGLLGALVFTAVLYLIARRTRASRYSLLLTGVMLGFFGSSLVAVWMVFSDTNGIQGVLFWLLGDLSRAQISGALAVWGWIGLLIVILFLNRAGLDALMLGEEGAATLGMDVPRLRQRLLLLTSLLIALCVCGAGMIGFVGLVVPHFARRLAGSTHTVLIPLSAILGATALVFADFVSRVALSPYEVPVGVVTSIIGAPLFVWLILQPNGFRLEGRGET